MKNKHNKNMAILIALAVAGVVLAIDVVIIAILDKQKSDDVANNVLQEVSTELKSGSVTTEIGGESVTYSAAYVVDGGQVTVNAGEFASDTDGQNVFLVINGGALRIEEGVEITKGGSDGADGADGRDDGAYGANAAVVVVGEGSSVSMEGVKVSTDTLEASAVMAVNGGEVLILNSEIRTTADNSRGLYATSGGEINADTVKVSTFGESSAALANDKGTLTAVNMTLDTVGSDSPLINTAGNTTVTNSTGSARNTKNVTGAGVDAVNLEGCEFNKN